ncbi:MAG: tryptophan-rich sensory protein, partial [Alistipes sp.]|nr:tryptophan-rich sensory protein [Alistipes sp.]
NFLWSILFFALRNPTLALLDIAALDILVVLYIIFSARVSRAAAWLFVPYLCWILFATYLNAYIQIAN